MAKDLTQLSLGKLIARLEAAADELDRRGIPYIEDLTDRMRRSRALSARQPDALPRAHRIQAPGIRVQADTYGEEPSPEDAEAAAEATKQRRLTHSKRVPVADPVYLAAFESARRRPAPKDEVRMADMNGILAPVTTGEAE